LGTLDQATEECSSNYLLLTACGNLGFEQEGKRKVQRSTEHAEVFAMTSRNLRRQGS
jgi:hypothetical protein